MVRQFSYPKDLRLFKHDGKAYKFDISFSKRISKEDLPRLYKEIKAILVGVFTEHRKISFSVEAKSVKGHIKKRKWLCSSKEVGDGRDLVKLGSESYRVRICPMSEYQQDSSFNDTSLESPCKMGGKSHDEILQSTIVGDDHGKLNIETFSPLPVFKHKRIKRKRSDPGYLVKHQASTITTEEFLTHRKRTTLHKTTTISRYQPNNDPLSSYDVPKVQTASDDFLPGKIKPWFVDNMSGTKRRRLIQLPTSPPPENEELTVKFGNYLKPETTEAKPPIKDKSADVEPINSFEVSQIEPTVEDEIVNVEPTQETLPNDEEKELNDEEEKELSDEEEKELSDEEEDELSEEESEMHSSDESESESKSYGCLLM